MNWQILTTIAIASKQIQNIMQRLNITPDKRAKGKKTENNQEFDLQKFLNASPNQFWLAPCSILFYRSSP